MSRWIDYDAIDYRNDKLHDKSEEFLNGVIYMAQRIENAPSIDIVRCAECKFWSENTQFCHMFSTRFTAQRMLPNDFCSLGVKKENE